MEDEEIIIKTLNREKELLQNQLIKRDKEKELLQKKLANKNVEIAEYSQNKEDVIVELKKENRELREKLDSILYSRSYRFIQKIIKLFKR